MFAACIVSIYYYLQICYSFCVKWCGTSAATLYRWPGHVRRAHNSLTSPIITPNRHNHPQALEFWMFKWFHAVLLTTCLRTYFSTTSRFNFILKSMQRGMHFKILLWNRWPYSNLRECVWQRMMPFMKLRCADKTMCVLLYSDQYSSIVVTANSFYFIL
jgi:hypothetical protein